MKQKIEALLKQLNQGLVEREEALKAALLTVLARENIVLIGPPGTGKSLIARRIADCLTYESNSSYGVDYFEYLLTKFSTPEEIFGPLSIAELKKDCFRRNTVGYLPTVKVAFLDEIFKASSSILNALLTILNERLYHNGATPQKVPLQALIAASNELPIDREELNALYDRFLVRSFVDYVSPDNLPGLFENTEPRPALTKLTSFDLEAIQRAAEDVTIPLQIVQAIQRIWAQHKETFKEDRREALSDRRLKKVIQLLRVSAATNGRNEVDLSDVFLIKNCLWNHQENALKVRDMILSILRAFNCPVPQTESENQVPAASIKFNGQSRSPVKGFKGSGTQEDPLLVQTFADLMDLGRPEVGLQGYYFQQISDIDCTSLSSWAEIDFKGHYDGGGYSIKSKPTRHFLETNWSALFRRIHDSSSLSSIRLEDLRLAEQISESLVIGCQSNIGFIGCVANNCKFFNCLAGDALIVRHAENCTITYCQAGNGLIGGAATNCDIADCLVLVDQCDYWKRLKLNGIAESLIQGSVVERCFVAGNCGYQGDGYIVFSGVTSVCDSSTIRGCAVGRLIKSSYGDVRFSRLVREVKNASILENNASIDTNPGKDNCSGNDGKTVAAALFKQRFFEYSLGWDFFKIWRWDDVNDRPALRSVGIGAASYQSKPALQNCIATDLLTQQMRSNIWL